MELAGHEPHVLAEKEDCKIRMDCSFIKVEQTEKSGYSQLTIQTKAPVSQAKLEEIRKIISESENQGKTIELSELKTSKDVTYMRKLIPRLLNEIFPLEAGHRRYDARPEDWPTDIAFLDPNNPQRIGGKKPNKEDLGKKPNKKDLSPMYDYLVGRYKERTNFVCTPDNRAKASSGNSSRLLEGTPIVEQGQNFLLIFPIPDDDQQHPLHPRMTRQSAFPATEVNLGLTSSQSKPCSDSEHLADPILGGNESLSSALNGSDHISSFSYDNHALSSTLGSNTYLSSKLNGVCDTVSTNNDLCAALSDNVPLSSSLAGSEHFAGASNSSEPPPAASLCANDLLSVEPSWDPEQFDSWLDEQMMTKDKWQDEQQIIPKNVAGTFGDQSMTPDKSYSIDLNVQEEGDSSFSRDDVSLLTVDLKETRSEDAQATQQYPGLQLSSKDPLLSSVGHERPRKDLSSTCYRLGHSKNIAEGGDDALLEEQLFATYVEDQRFSQPFSADYSKPEPVEKTKMSSLNMHMCKVEEDDFNVRASTVKASSPVGIKPRGFFSQTDYLKPVQPPDEENVLNMMSNRKPTEREVIVQAKSFRSSAGLSWPPADFQATATWQETSKHEQYEELRGPSSEHQSWTSISQPVSKVTQSGIPSPLPQMVNSQPLPPGKPKKRKSACGDDLGVMNTKKKKCSNTGESQTSQLCEGCQCSTSGTLT